jgi:hypothetical protein
MANGIDAAVAAMESQAANLGFLDSIGEAAQVSMAISLKRIADALDGTVLGLDASDSIVGLTMALAHGRHK